MLTSLSWGYETRCLKGERMEIVGEWSYVDGIKEKGLKAEK